MQFNKYVALALLLIMSSLQATVVQMAEFYHPGLNQTIILMYDVHAYLPEIDRFQIEDVMPTIRKTQAYLITEGNLSNDGSKIMAGLAQTCQNEKLSVIPVEFRFAYSGYIYTLEEVLHTYTKYDDIIAALLNPGMAEHIGKSFVYALYQNCDQLFSVIDPYVTSILSLQEDYAINKLYLEQFDTLLGQAATTCNIIGAWIRDGKDEFIMSEESFKNVTARLVDNLFIKKDDGAWMLNTDSMYHKMEQASNTLLDVTLLQALHQKRNERVVFVHAGALHMITLANQCLPHIGFELKYSIGNVNELRQKLDSLLLNESSQCTLRAVDIEAFLKECKTLPSVAV